MNLLPPSTNSDYQGARSAVFFLGLISLLTIVPAMIHIFLPDGGAGVIAGLDLSQNGDLIVSLFAWAGTTQLVWGMALLLVTVRYRSFIPLFLALLLLERSIHALNMWVLKGDASGHHPPEAYGTLIMVPLILLFLLVSLRTRDAS